jgi:XapX domain-containing protein
MSYLISILIGIAVGLLYGALDFRSPAPPAVALVGLTGMLLGEKLWPMGKQLLATWAS